MNPALIVTVLKALVKGKLRVGKLNGLERVMLSQFMVPDRVVTMLVATNIEPYEIDPQYNYVRTTQDAGANLELFDKVRQRFHADMIVVPAWMGLLTVGAAELGTQFAIEERRVPYAVGYPIKSIDDVAKISIPSEASGYLKMYFDINRMAQKRYPDTMIFPVFDGPWDMAMLLRGDQFLPRDFRLHKDYVETDDPQRKAKIRQFGDPDLYPAIMDLTTKLAIRHVELAKAHGLDLLGAALVDQFAAKPILSLDDFVTYVLPYIERVQQAHGNKLTLGYMYTSPQDIERGLENKTLRAGVGLAGMTNYIFPQTPDGLSLPEYDLPMLQLAKRLKKSYSYLLHGKFIRDATEPEIEDAVKRICGMATEMQAGMSLGMVSIPPGTDLGKINLVLDLADKYGRY